MKRSIPLPYLAVTIAALTTAPVFAQTVVPTAPFDSVELEGGGHVVLRYGEVQQVRLLRGSTEFTRFQVEDGRKLKIEICRNECPRHYDLDVEITTPRIEALAVSGGGRIEGTDGFPGPHKIALAVDGGGEIDTRALEVGHAVAAIDGGGMIKLRASEELTAAINGGGDIKYWGNPKVTQAIEGGGEVEQEN